MIKFRCSSLHSLMTEPRSKSQELSETTKTFLNTLAIELETGRRKNIETACMKKGTQSEAEGITMFCEHFGVAFPYETDKEKKKYENKYITGTPDYVPWNKSYLERFGVIDIKSSWDLYTFPSSPFFEVPSVYYWQMQGYMALTGVNKATLAYVLVNTPQQILDWEIKKLSYILLDATIEEIEEKVKFNHTFDDLPIKRRIKTFEILKNEEDIEKIYKKVETARDFLQKNYNI